MKHSSTADGEETKTTRREPNLREMIPQFFLDMFMKERWIGGFMTWRWPRMGREVRLGGRFLRLALDLSRSLKKSSTIRLKEQSKELRYYLPFRPS